MSLSKNTLLLIVIGLVLLAAIGYLMFGKSAPGAAVSAAGTPHSDAELTFINLTAEIEPVTFDTSILNDPRFMSLQDIHTAILPETSGRKDPFAPLPGVSGK